MTSSDNGVNWSPVVIDGAWVAGADGSLLHVGGWPAGRSGLVIATSTDNGATWTTSELPVSDPGLRYVQAQPNVAAVGTVNNDVESQTYSVEQLGFDHGQMDSMGSPDGGAPGQVTVRCADGFELTVDPAEFGLDSMFAGAGPVTVTWVWDGTAWEQIRPPFGSFAGQPTIAFGPAGYVALGSPIASTAGPVELRVFRSLDGRTWQDTPCRAPCPPTSHRSSADRSAASSSAVTSCTTPSMRSPGQRCTASTIRTPSRAGSPRSTSRPGATGSSSPSPNPNRHPTNLRSLFLTRRRDLGRCPGTGRHPQRVRRLRQPIRRRHPRDHRPINGHTAGRLPR